MIGLGYAGFRGRLLSPLPAEPLPPATTSISCVKAHLPAVPGTTRTVSPLTCASAERDGISASGFPVPGFRGTRSKRRRREVRWTAEAGGGLPRSERSALRWPPTRPGNSGVSDRWRCPFPGLDPAGSDTAQ